MALSQATNAPINSQRRCYVQDQQDHKILGLVLEVMCHLINYGYFDSTSDVNVSMTALVGLLKSKSGDTDVKYRYS